MIQSFGTEVMLAPLLGSEGTGGGGRDFRGEYNELISYRYVIF